MLPAVMPTYLHALAVNGSVAVKAGGALREIAIAQPTGVWKFTMHVIKVALIIFLRLVAIGLVACFAGPIYHAIKVLAAGAGGGTTLSQGARHNQGTSQAGRPRTGT